MPGALGSLAAQRNSSFNLKFYVKSFMSMDTLRAHTWMKGICVSYRVEALQSIKPAANNTDPTRALSLEIYCSLLSKQV